MGPPVGSSIPTLVSRGADPLNGAASKRPHSPTLEEQAKRLKETEKARIHIAWTHRKQTGFLRNTPTGGALQLSQTPRRWLHTGTRERVQVGQSQEWCSRKDLLKSWEITDLPVVRRFGQCCRRPLTHSQPGGAFNTTLRIYLTRDLKQPFFYSSSPWVFKDVRRTDRKWAVLLLIFPFFQLTF